MAIHWREASDGQEHWLMHWGWLRSDQACTQANNMLAVFPLTTARDRRWWSHYRSLMSPEMSTSFCATQLKKGAVDLPYTPVVSIATGWLKVVIVKKVIIFLAFVGLSISCYTAWHSGPDYVVTFCKGVHNCHVPYKAPASAPGVQGQTIGPSIFRQANGLKDRGETNGGQWSLGLIFGGCLIVIYQKMKLQSKI